MLKFVSALGLKIVSVGCALAATILVLGFATTANAGEGLFSRAYTVETEPEGHFELEQLVRAREGRAFGTYHAYDLRSEVEYGVTDKFQIALYVNSGYINAKDAPDDDSLPEGQNNFSRTRFELQGVTFEMIYRILNPITDGIGLALYLEPEVNFADLHNGLQYSLSMGNEYKVILQKNFFGDQLITVLNTGVETEFIRFRNQDGWRGELDFNTEFGITYRVASAWYAGLEFRNHTELGDFVNHEHSIYWAGPVAHYANEKWWATLGLLAQVYGVPSGHDDQGNLVGNDNLFLRSHERYELTFKAALPM